MRNCPEPPVGQNLNLKGPVVRAKFIIASSLITDCILGIDFLANHRINLDFAKRVITGPTLGRIAALDLPNNLEDINH